MNDIPLDRCRPAARSLRRLDKRGAAMKVKASVHSTKHDSLGRTVRETRARRSMSQEELGHQARLHRNYVGAIERGEINPTFRVLLKLSRGLRVPLSELIALTEQRHRETYREPLGS
jgi:ribosome-binding protein aMBF1 (putative translation factor)